LEESEFVRSRPEESDRGGPTRKIYSPTSEFTMIVDVGPGLFNVEIVTPEDPGIIEDQMPPSFEIQEKMTHRGFKQEIDSLKGDISGVDRELDDLHVRRAALIKLKEKTLEKARRYVETNVNDNQPSLSSQELGRELGIREEIVIDLLEEVDAIGGKKDGRED
jgi:predicted transcriptional regulator